MEMIKQGHSSSQFDETIRETLIRIGAISESEVEVFADRTRDSLELKVFRDQKSKVIFIDDFYVGDDEYVSGKYREDSNSMALTMAQDYEDSKDNERRLNTHKQFITGKTICDFGCGAGSFLRLSQPSAKKVYGVELQQNYRESLNSTGIETHESLQLIPDKLDVMTMFHCLEHLPKPSSTLREIHTSLKQGGEGRLIVEVPHARDFLLDFLKVEEFVEFTLWSQHLILHTKESLRLTLTDAGFKNIIIEGTQRYGLANHLSWLAYKRPGGHKSSLSIFESSELFQAYKNALASIDSTDTITAIAST